MLQKDGPCDKSPLQMLAQTCSQIGADPGPAAAKPSTAAAGDKGKAAAGARKGGGSPTIVVTDAKPVPFKPYESSKEVTAKPVDSKRASESGSAKSASPHFDSRCVDTSTSTADIFYGDHVQYIISSPYLSAMVASGLQENTKARREAAMGPSPRHQRTRAAAGEQRRMAETRH